MDKQKKKLLDFQNLLCKQQSKQCDKVLKQMITYDPLLNQQYLYLLCSKNRLPLITFSVLTHPPSKPRIIKLLMHLCQQLPSLNPKHVVQLWKSIYLLYPSQQSNRYQLFYESLSTFCFGGVNRKSQCTSLQLLAQLFKTMKQRIDNQLLIPSTQDYTKNFLKYNISEVGYIRTMNVVITMKEIGLDVDLFSLINRYLKYVEETKKKQGMHEIQAELMYGLEGLGVRVLESAYLIGSIHEYVLEGIEEMLRDNVFVVRNAARRTITVWNQVQQRYQREVEEKQVKFNIKADMDDLIEEKVLQNENQSKIMKYIDKTQKYALVQQVSHKKAMNKLLEDFSQVQSKDFLKKKTGNGGGYIHIDEPGKNGSKYYKRYENVFNKMDQYAVTPTPIKKEYFVEDDQYTNNSHHSNKYQLEKTIQYPDYDHSEELLIDQLIDKKQPKKDLSVMQIQRLIDMAYANYSKAK